MDPGLLLGLRLVWSGILAIEYSYEYNEGLVLAIDDRTDWFFRLDMLETVYGGEVLRCRMPRPVYSRC